MTTSAQRRPPHTMIRRSAPLASFLSLGPASAQTSPTERAVGP